MCAYTTPSPKQPLGREAATLFLEVITYLFEGTLHRRITSLALFDVYFTENFLRGLLASVEAHIKLVVKIQIFLIPCLSTGNLSK